jgi:hypothetical protein
MSSIPTTHRKNAQGQSVFPGPPDCTHDADGLTPEEREKLPYPYNCYTPDNWPASRFGTPTPIDLLPKEVHDIRELNLMYEAMSKQDAVYQAMSEQDAVNAPAP